MVLTQDGPARATDEVPVRGPTAPRPSRPYRPLNVPRAVLQFTLAGIVALVAVGSALVFATRSVGVRDAVRSAQDIAQLEASVAVEPRLTPAVIANEPNALADFDAFLRSTIINDDTVRVKIWDESGRVIWSDEPSLIGQVFPLEPEDLGVLHDGSVDAHVSDLSKAENGMERDKQPLVEIYVGIQSTDGQKLLFEAYRESDSVSSDGRRLWRDFAPALIGGLVMLQAVQTPLAWSLARRVRNGQRERDALLLRNLEVGDIERRRIAANLHDSVIPSISGTSFGLDGVADDVERHSPTLAAEIRTASRSLRDDVRGLRTLLGEIYPTTLKRDGLASALAELAAPLRAGGTPVEIDVPQMRYEAEFERLAFRVAQEALRNIAKHAAARRVSIRLTVAKNVGRLTVSDDGRGFNPDAIQSNGEPHLGLRILQDVVAERGGVLTIESAPDAGTTLTMEVALP